jgi:hypothetical protein
MIYKLSSCGELRGWRSRGRAWERYFGVPTGRRDYQNSCHTPADMMPHTCIITPKETSGDSSRTGSPRHVILPRCQGILNIYSDVHLSFDTNLDVRLSPRTSLVVHPTCRPAVRWILVVGTFQVLSRTNVIPGIYCVQQQRNPLTITSRAA